MLIVAQIGILRQVRGSSQCSYRRLRRTNRWTLECRYTRLLMIQSMLQGSRLVNLAPEASSIQIPEINNTRISKLRQLQSDRGWTTKEWPTIGESTNRGQPAITQTKALEQSRRRCLESQPLAQWELSEWPRQIDQLADNQTCPDNHQRARRWDKSSQRLSLILERYTQRCRTYDRPITLSRHTDKVVFNVMQATKGTYRRSNSILPNTSSSFSCNSKRSPLLIALTSLVTLVSTCHANRLITSWPATPASYPHSSSKTCLPRQCLTQATWAWINRHLRILKCSSNKTISWSNISNKNSALETMGATISNNLQPFRSSHLLSSYHRPIILCHRKISKSSLTFIITLAQIRPRASRHSSRCLHSKKSKQCHKHKHSITPCLFL